MPTSSFIALLQASEGPDGVDAAEVCALAPVTKISANANASGAFPNVECYFAELKIKRQQVRQELVAQSDLGSSVARRAAAWDQLSAIDCNVIIDIDDVQRLHDRRPMLHALAKYEVPAEFVIMPPGPAPSAPSGDGSRAQVCSFIRVCVC